MEYGCIGEHLSHSFSKEIHEHIADYEYTLRELSPSEVAPFMLGKNFKAINVTIPYKETVIPFLDEMDEGARLIGSVNTVVNREGKLFGYNTDFYGLSALIKKAKIDPRDKKVLVLGTGGTSKTAEAVCRSLKAREIVKASRKAENGGILYNDVYKYHTDSEIIINTTPVGMFPNIWDMPIDLMKFPRLEGIIDAIYNPLSTELVLKARELGIPAEGGLYMLVAQGVRASEHFLSARNEDELTDRIYEAISQEKRSIVLIGMPSSGKTTVGKMIADELSRRFIDTDALIEERYGPIPQIFKERGEDYFRLIESEIIKEISAISGAVIATGGGAVLKKENISALRKNGRIYFIDRPLALLIPTKDRPLAGTKNAIEDLYRERIEIYRTAADVTVDASVDTRTVALRIISNLRS